MAMIDPRRFNLVCFDKNGVEKEVIERNKPYAVLVEKRKSVQHQYKAFILKIKQIR